MSIIPSISPYSSRVTALLPFLFVLSLSLIREGYEDIQKAKNDSKVNNQYKTTIIKNGRL